MNTLVLLSDNHNRAMMGASGHPLARTPNLDALAAAGVRFASAYCASPICCPARAAIATGRFPHQTGYWDNVQAYDGAVPSWMHRAREAGREVVAVGKLHFRGGDDYGFTEEIVPMHLHAGQGAVKTLLRGYDAEAEKAGTDFHDMYARRSGPGHSEYQEYDRRITEAACAWLTGRATRPGTPGFILFVSWISPHPPFSVPEALLAMYPTLDVTPPPGAPHPVHPAEAHLKRLERIPERLDPDDLRRANAAYLALVTHLDAQVGAVLAAARALGPLTILYTSDHGELCGERDLWGKRFLYEGSAGVPLLMAGPGLPEGGVRHAPVSHIDLFPTLLEAAGVAPVPQDAGLHGRSLFGPARGAEDPDRPVFAEYHAHGSAAGAFMLRRGALKLIRHVGMPDQLFDLASDPAEREDLGARPEHAGARAALAADLARFCDPADADARAKAAQRRRAEALGGPVALAAAPHILWSPPPGTAVRDDQFSA